MPKLVKGVEQAGDTKPKGGGEVTTIVSTAVSVNGNGRGVKNSSIVESGLTGVPEAQLTSGVKEVDPV
jgi:hypothetical protein